MRNLGLYKKELISLLLIVLLAIFFWSNSRYPQLNEKQSMGDRISISSALNFEELVPYVKSDVLYKRVIKSSINWFYTNWKGMAFGFLFAACFLTLFQNLNKKILESSNIYLQSLIGIFIGAPLGVCVNCATPIGKGMISSGQRVITSLSTMVASPSLNIVVLGMMFTLFPVDFGLFKIFFTGFFLLVILPTIVHWIKGQSEQKVSKIPTQKKISWSTAILEIYPSLFKNLFFILKTTLPFMILSGLLGSFIVEVFPLENLSSLTINLKSLFITALIGTLLPVPIAFDLIITFLLMNLGLPIGLCFTLFFTLGIFSIYPFFVIWRDLSFKLAMGIFLAVMLTGMAGGFALNTFNKLLILKTEQYLKDTGENPSEIFKIIKNSCTELDPKNIEACINLQVNDEARVGVGEKICNNLKGVENIESCRFTGILKLNDPKACNTLGRLKDRCIKSFKDSLPLYKKINLKFCKDIKNEKERLICLNGLKASIEHSPNKNWCQYLENHSLIQSCIFNQVVNEIKRGGNKKICNALSHPELIKTCLKEANFQAVMNKIKQSGKDWCKDLLVPAQFYKCKKVVLDWKVSTGEYDELYCKSIKDKKLRDFCLDKYFISIVKKTKDITYCQKAINPSFCESEIYSLMEDIICDFSSKSYQKSCLAKKKDKTIKKEIFNFKASYLKAINAQKAFDSAFNFENYLETPKMKKSLVYKGQNYKVFKIPLNKKTTTIFKNFSTIEGEEIGLDYPLTYYPEKRFEPFAHSLGIASGDFNNDHWADILVPSGNKIFVYQNMGGKFKRNIIPTSSPVILVAFVDINNDGFQDIFYSKWKGGSGFYINDKGIFKADKLVEIPGTKNNITMAASFGDLNGNGNLDFYLGNWSFGTFASEKAPFKSSLNQLFINKDSSFFETEISGSIGGETLSVLISDINDDGRPDLLEANDFGISDKYFLNTLTGFRLKENYPPISPVNSMSIDTADIDGDLKTDIFSVDLDFAHEIPLLGDNYCENIKNEKVKKNCQKNIDLRKIIASRNPKDCLKQSYARPCLAQILVELAMEFKEKTYCHKIPSDFSHLKSICLDQFRVKEQQYIDLKNVSELQVTSNILLKGGDELTDISSQMGIRNSGWSWNAKFSDLDNDGWIDIYVGNGYLIKDLVTPNVFYKNLKGKRFVRQEKQFGLDDSLHTSSFTYVDYDNDGDLDIFSTGINAPIRVFKNQNENNSIQFNFKNKKNVFGIGYKITIYGENFKRIGEIKLGGGYQSFDHPIAHFGLRNDEKVMHIKISRPFKKDFKIPGPFYFGNRYLITLD